MICPVDSRARETAREIGQRNQFAPGFSAGGVGAAGGAVAGGGATSETITGMENTRDTMPSAPSVSMLAVITNTPARAGINTI